MEFIRSTPIEPGKWRQLLAVIVVNIASLSYGVIIGFISSTIPIFLMLKNPANENLLTAEHIFWLQSVMCIAGILTFPLCSLISERFGRKIIGYLIAILFAAFWLIIIFSANYWWLVVTRVFAGVGGAFVFFLAPLYVTEISGDSIRGLLGTFRVFAFNIGIFSAYILASRLSYQLFAICALPYSIFFFGCFFLMPETPTYLVRKNRITDATKSLMWLKNGDQSAVDQELLKLQDLAKNNSNINKIMCFCPLFRDRATIKGFIIANVLLSGQQLCGITFMLAFITTIFHLAGSTFSPGKAITIVCGIQIIGPGLSILFMERAGRRLLIQISCLGMLLCHVAVATFYLLQSLSIDVSSFRWLPLVALFIYVIVYGLGMGSAPFIVASEVFSPDIAALGCSVSMTIMMIVTFAMLRLYPIATELLNLYGCFYLFSTFCGCILVFTYFFIPETKGRSIDSIIDELNGRSRRLNENSYMKASIEMNEKNIDNSSR